MKQENSVLTNKRYSATAFIIIFITCVAYALLRGCIVPIYDSAYYCSIGDGVIDKSGIHFNLFPKTFRGCLLPIFIQLLKVMPFGFDIGWKLIASLVSSVLFVGIIPRIITGNGIDNAKKLISSVISPYIYGVIL